MSQNSEPREIDIVHSNDAKAFMDTVRKTVKGDTIIYARGKSLHGRHARAAMDAAEAELVCLVQRRLPKSNFEYIAQRTNRRLSK